MTAYAVNAEHGPTDDVSTWPPAKMGQYGIASQEQSVFIDNIQLMEDVERIILAKSVIRLQLLDQCIAPFDYAMYSSARFGLIVAGNKNDRKLIGSRRSIVGLQNQLLDQMVEARPEMMNDLSGSDTDQLKPAILSSVDIEAISPEIARGIILMRDDICFDLERLDKRVKILDLLVGPLNLDPNSLKWSHKSVRSE